MRTWDAIRDKDPEDLWDQEEGSWLPDSLEEVGSPRFSGGSPSLPPTPDLQRELLGYSTASSALAGTFLLTYPLSLACRWDPRGNL